MNGKPLFDGPPLEQVLRERLERAARQVLNAPFRDPLTPPLRLRRLIIDYLEPLEPLVLAGKGKVTERNTGGQSEIDYRMPYTGSLELWQLAVTTWPRVHRPRGRITADALTLTAAFWAADRTWCGALIAAELRSIEMILQRQREIIARWEQERYGDAACLVADQAWLRPAAD